MSQPAEGVVFAFDEESWVSRIMFASLVSQSGGERMVFNRLNACADSPAKKIATEMFSA